MPNQRDDLIVDLLQEVREDQKTRAAIWCVQGPLPQFAKGIHCRLCLSCIEGRRGL